MEPNASQSRAARALLNWSAPDLAKAVGVSPSTIQRFEAQGNARLVMVWAIRAVFEAHGVEFVPGGAKLRQQPKQVCG